jgi:hypothetical protein
VLALQRTVGNRAVQRILTDSEGAGPLRPASSLLQRQAPEGGDPTAQGVTPAQALEELGTFRVELVEGEVWVDSPMGVGVANVTQGPGRYVLAVGDEVLTGSTVKTGSKSKAKLTGPDGSEISIGSDSQLTISPADFSASDAISRAKIWLGRLANAIGMEDDSFEVTTANAVAGVRG